MSALDVENFHEIMNDNKTIWIRGREVLVEDPTEIFERALNALDFENHGRDYMAFELTAYPLSLFNETGMRKGKKSHLFSIFKPCGRKLSNIWQYSYIIDGGMLLYKIDWKVGEQFGSIFQRLIDFIHKKFGRQVTVVFDGYRRVGTKSFDRIRRATFVEPSDDLQVEERSTLTVTRDSFLGNSRNKEQFIENFVRKLNAVNISYCVAEEDADAKIVRTAIQEANHTNNKVVIVAEDIDVLVLMASLCPRGIEMFFYKMGSPTRKIPPKIYSSTNCLKQEFENCKDHLLFLHAFTGCDTTSVFYAKGKVKFAKILNARKDIQAAAEIFQSKQDVQGLKNKLYNAGSKCVLALYGAPENVDCVNEWRYLKYFVKTKKKPKIHVLPPTHDAMIEHLKRVYHQIQAWQGRMLSAPRWGWEKKGNVLAPVTTPIVAATDFVLNKIFCNCKSGGNCGKKCGCLKKDLKCSNLCHCRC